MMDLPSSGAVTAAVLFFGFTAAALVLLLIRYRTQTRQLQATNEYLATIIDSANEGIYATDRERRFILWNGAAARITGYGKDEVIGRFCHDNILCHVDRLGKELCHSRCPLDGAVKTGCANGPEIIYLRHRSGRRIPVEVKTAPIRTADGVVTGGVEIFQDVTERLEQEQLLGERQEKLEAVLDSIGDGILFLDTAGAVAVVNHACAETFALGKTIIGSPIRSLPEDLPLRRALAAAEQGYGRHARTGAGAESAACLPEDDLIRCWTARIDPSTAVPRSPCFTCAAYQHARTFLESPRELTWEERTFSVVSSFIEHRESNELREIIVFHDVTAEKLDAALKVAGAAAHELRQPLQVAVLVATMLKNELQGNAAVAEHVDAVMTSCERMDLIIHQMGELTSYRTKDYTKGKKILDIEHSSGSR